MSQTDELLNSMYGSNTRAYSPTGSEGHIVVGEDRFITVPEELKRIAVQHDHFIETVTFDCPRYWDGHDMSQMIVYINYKNKGGQLGAYIAQNVRVDASDSNIMHFEWTISRNVTNAAGPISFLVCVRKTKSDGELTNHWNSEICSDMYVSEGLEATEEVIESDPDILTQLLTIERKLLNEDWEFTLRDGTKIRKVVCIRDA